MHCGEILFDYSDLILILPFFFFYWTEFEIYFE